MENVLYWQRFLFKMKGKIYTWRSGRRVGLIWKKSAELRELLGLDPVSLVIKKNRLRCFGQVEHIDDIDWIKYCTTMEVDVKTELDKRGCRRKTCWDGVREDIKRYGLSRQDA